jgi:HEAT repeat protein
MYGTLVVAIYAIGSVFAGLTLLIVVNKAVRETRARWRRVRRYRLEPKVLHYVHGGETSLLHVLGGPLSRADRSVLEEILLGQIQRVRGIERERLRHAFDEFGFVAEHLAQLRSARWWSRAKAAEKLGQSGAKRAIDELTTALGDDSPEVRIRAAKALGEVGGVAAIRPLIQALREPSRWSSIRIADILAEMGPQVVDELIEHFAELDTTAKLSCLDILGRVRSPRTAPWLRARLADAEPDVRARAAHALGSLGDLEASSALRRSLGDSAWPVRAMAAKGLGRIRSFDAIPELCAAMRDREWWVRSNSAHALRQLGRGGLDALVYMLDDQDDFARHQAVFMLEEAGVLDEKVALLSKDGDEGEVADAIVRRFVDAGQTERLLELAASHRDRAVRSRLKQLLDEGNKTQGAA